MEQDNSTYRICCPVCNKRFRTTTPPHRKRFICSKCGTKWAYKKPSQIIDAELVINAELVSDPPLRTAEPGRHSSNPQAFVSPEHLRVGGENLVLYGTLAFSVLLFAVFSFSSFFIFALLFFLAYTEVRHHQSQLRRVARSITADANPQLFHLITLAANRLTMPVPQFFLIESTDLNAFATGFDNPGTVVLNSGLFGKMNQEEIIFIIGHELTHLKCGHCRYMLFTDSAVGSTINYVIASLMNLIFLAWSRKCEFTCDRGGLVACKNPSAAMSALAKIMGAESTGVEQIVQSAISQNMVGNNFLATHPEIENRIKAVFHFSRSPEFQYLESMSN